MTTLVQEKEITGLTNLLWRRKMPLMGFCLVSIVLTMAVSLSLPKYYRSEAVVIATGPEAGGLSAMLSASPLASAFPGGFGGLSTPADKILAFLKTRTVAEMVIRKFDLMRVFNEKKWDPAKGDWKNPKKRPYMEDTVKKLSQSVTSFKKSREGTISIIVEWKDPKLASEIANYYIVALADFMKNKAVNITVQTLDPALVPERKSSPKTVVNMAEAGIVSLMLGVFFFVLIEKRKP